MPSIIPTTPRVVADGEIIGPADYSIQVVAQLRPFTSMLTMRRFPAGTTLAEILENLQPIPVLRRCSHVSVAGDQVPRALLHRVRPKPGRLVNITCVPQGGGGRKSPLRFILTLVVLAASVVTAGLPALSGAAFGGLFGAGVTWGSIAGAGYHGSGPLVTCAFRTRFQ
jgi:hypothetical protein